MSKPETLTVTVTKHFRASAERVYDAWLKPESARQWLFATPDGEMVAYEIDPRVGGGFRFTDRRDGKEWEHVGTYIELTRPHRIVFDFALPAIDPKPDRVTIEIKREGNGCKLTLTHVMDAKYADYFDQTVNGWTKMLAMMEPHT